MTLYSCDADDICSIYIKVVACSCEIGPLISERIVLEINESYLSCKVWGQT